MDIRTEDLPALTLKRANATVEIDNEKDAERRWRLEWEFLRDVLGEDAVAEQTGSEEFEEVDLSAIDALYIGVVNAYARPALEARNRQLQEQLSAFDSLDMSKLGQLVSAMQEINAGPAKTPRSRQGFARVK